MTQEQRAEKGETRNLSCRNSSGRVFITHRVEFQGSCLRAWTSLFPFFQGPGVETIIKRSLKTIVMGNMVNLKYLIRIYFLQKHELGGLCEQCREGKMPSFLWVWLSSQLMSQLNGLEMGSLPERGHLVLRKGQSLKVVSLSSELAGCRQSRQEYLAESLANGHLLNGGYQAVYHPENG